MTRKSKIPPMIAASMIFALPLTAQSFVEMVIYTFDGPVGDTPHAGLIQTADGNLYGTTEAPGTVFEVSNLTRTPAASLTYRFGAPGDGSYPTAALIQASDGNLYGTTTSGGFGNRGTVFKISGFPSAPVESVVHSFAGGSDGDGPYGSLIQASDGNLYGTTGDGGLSNRGTVFKITSLSTTPSESVIYSFAGGNDGANPIAALIEASDGNLYGTTSVGGLNNKGTVFRISNLATVPTESVIHTFGSGSDGAVPETSVMQASDGNFYGTTAGGGIGNLGTIYKISTPTTAPVESVIHSFAGGSDGANPQSSLIQALDGNLYGTTFAGGASNLGTAFEVSNLSSIPAETVVYVFSTIGEGYAPYGALLQASDGYLYGTTSGGGTVPCCGLPPEGTVFRLAKPTADTQLGYHTLAPCRLVDTRPSSTAPFGGPPLAGGGRASFSVSGQCGVPLGAAAVSANLTVVSPQAGGDLRCFPTLIAHSTTSVINFTGGRTRANNALLALDAFGSLTFQCDMPPSTSTNVLVDLNGYFE